MMSAPAARVVLETFSLANSPFKTYDPFLFFAHHNDQYPAGQANQGPDRHLLMGRHIGSDFSFKDGWCMYHGDKVPGFPEHPHRGFETISIVTEGLVDHFDSKNCTARYGNGDTQWLTAGSGIQHSEMFPLVNMDRPNPLNFAQLWLNLPRKSKMCEPNFAMMWDELTPRATLSDPATGKAAVVRVVAGELNGVKPLPPPPHSWAADPNSDVAVWEIRLPANVTATFPPAKSGNAANRAFYFLGGSQLQIGGEAAPLPCRMGARVRADQPLTLQALGSDAQIILLQGRPIGEPVVQYGPFVMNSEQEIQNCFADFRKTSFGGWPWGASDYCHAREQPRHAVHGDGVPRYPPGVSAPQSAPH